MIRPLGSAHLSLSDDDYKEGDMEGCPIAAGAHEPWIQVRLDDFLGVMPDWICVAVELRQPSWDAHV